MSSRFGSTDYNPTGGSSDGGDYEDYPSILIDKYCIVEFTLSDVGVYAGDYGSSVILTMEDVVVKEGVVTERESDGRIKLMDWGKWYDRNEDKDLIPFDGEDEISVDQLGRKVTESAGGDNYRYTIQQGIREGRDDPVELGDFEFWLSNGKKARTICKVLSQHGHDIIDADNKRDDYDWLNAEDADEFALRDDLRGRRMEMWFEDETIEPSDENDLEEPVTFVDSVLLDAETQIGIVIDNDESRSESTAESDESDEDESVELPEEVDNLVDMFARTGQDDRASIRNILEDEAPDDFDLDMDAIMAEIESRG